MRLISLNRMIEFASRAGKLERTKQAAVRDVFFDGLARPVLSKPEILQEFKWKLVRLWKRRLSADYRALLRGRLIRLSIS